MPNPNRCRWRGVNLGGWLVLEKWMTPSLFAGRTATDETTWCAELGADARAVLGEHWRRWITREDFLWLASIGIDAVRLPLGHWVLGPPYPWHPAYGSARQPFVEGGIDVVDRVMDWAGECGIAVMLDLHAAPGCQNGFDNGGILNTCDWPARAEYIDHSVELLGRLAARYRGQRAFAAIEVLNEPRWDIPTPLLHDYYRRAYAAVRAHAPAGEVTVVFHDGFRPVAEYAGYFDPAVFTDVAYDVHRYQCFERADLDLDIGGHVAKAGVDWAAEAERTQQTVGIPALAGEWSLGLDLRVVSLWHPGPYDHALDHVDRYGEDIALRAYAGAQLTSFERYRAGWFFWSYRTETTPAWSFRDAVTRGWLPSRFD
jgi:glucan 1,3-beta-glucosidase